MGSPTSAINPGVANLLQNLSSINSPALSSPAVQAALEKAPAGDIVQLSAAALQLQNVDALFGSTTTDSASSDPFASLLSGTTSTATTPQSIAALQLQNIDTLFGTQDTSTTPSTTDSITSQLLTNPAAASASPYLQSLNTDASLLNLLG